MTWRIKFIGTGLFKEPPLPLSERNDCNVFSNDSIEWFLLDGDREIMIKSLRLWIKETSLINLIKKRIVCLCKVCLQTSINFHCPRKVFVNKNAHISEDHLFSLWHSWTFYFGTQSSLIIEMLEHQHGTVRSKALWTEIRRAPPISCRPFPLFIYRADY